MKILSLMLMILLSMHCKEYLKGDNNSANQKSILLHSEINNFDTLYHSNDTIAFVNYINDKAVLLYWGVNEKFFNISQDTLYYPNGEFISFEKEGKYFVAFDGCGTACNYMYIASIKPGDQGNLYYYPLAVNLSNDLICYQGGDEFLVIIKNLENGKSIEIKEEFNKYRRPYSLSIDTCYFNNTSFLISWEKPSGEKSSREIDITSITSKD